MRFQIIGVDEPSKIITDFWNTLNSDKVNENILVDSDVEVVNADGVQIICIHVPQADWMAKPISLNGNVYKGTYRRNNEGDYHCTEAQVKAAVKVNGEKLLFNWQMGRDLVQKKAEERWGAGVVEQVSLDLRREFPQEDGFSARNLHYMKQWYLYYTTEASKLQRPIAEIVLMDGECSCHRDRGE